MNATASLRLKPNGYMHRLLALVGNRDRLEAVGCAVRDFALDSPVLAAELRDCGELVFDEILARHRLTPSGRATLALLDDGLTVEVKRFGGGS